MHIFIPSRARAGKISKLIYQLPPEYLPRTIVLYPLGEIQSYSAYLEAWDGILSIPVPNEWRIARKRRHIGEVATRLGANKFLMLDDDIQFLVRQAPDDWRLRETTPDEIGKCFRFIEVLLDNFSHVGVSAREGNNRMGIGTPEGLFSTNTRLMRAVAWRTADYNALEHERVEVMEDFDLSLQALRKGGGNACLYYWAQGQRSTGDVGGCAVWRTREVHDAGARKLAELHTPYVRLRQKQNKTGGLAERLEVTISWKKAAEESVCT